MAYIALYRKWRPRTFRDLVGQEHISKTLLHAIQANRIGHAYLFSGPRGTGKTSAAKILAKSLNCKNGPTTEPCGICENCKKIDAGSSMDVFEIDAASNRGIDEIRDIRETVKFAPASGRYKVYIIDEVHMLTTEAFNALLKTLEEPPSQVIFILATTEAHKVPATIQSRCQRYDFRRIATEEIQARLQYVADEMKIEVEPEALMLIAIQADGGLRDALSILDQCASIEDGCVTAQRVRQILGLVGHQWIFRLAKAIFEGNMQEILEMLAGLLRDGKELRQVLVELSLHLRGLMIYQATGSMEQVGLYLESQEILDEQSRYWEQEELVQMIRRLHEAMNELKWSIQPRITVEVALLSLCRKEAFPRKEALPSAARAEDVRIAQLESKLAQIAASLAAGGPKKEEMQETAKPVKQPTKQKPAQIPSGLPVQEDADGAAVLKKMVQAFSASGKVPVLACVKQATCIGMTEEQYILRFPGHIMADMAMKLYRKHIEPELERITGRRLQLVCSEVSLPQAAKKPAVKKEIPETPEERAVREEYSSLEKLSPKEQENIRSSLDFLDGELVPLPNSAHAAEAMEQPSDMDLPPLGDDDVPPLEEKDE